MSLKFQFLLFWG